MTLAGQKVLVVGMGKTGLSTARFLSTKDARITISDSRPAEELSPASGELVKKGILLETGGHRCETFLKADLIVVSPGVPLNLPQLVKAQQRGIAIVSEIELAHRFLRTPLIAVTGTNGKTTTTSLLGAMFKRAGKDIFVGGNIGIPLIEYVCGKQDKHYVITEISSFQLEGIRTFRPWISVMLNISEDHLDRYRSLNEYIAAKKRLFMNQQAGDKAVLNFDDPAVRLLGQNIKAEKFFFSASSPLAKGVFCNGALQFRDEKQTESIALTDVLLKGAHNLENIMAAVCVGWLCKLPGDKIQDTLSHFMGLEHRMEFVAEIKGVQFYNDSKGTNVGAVKKSIESLSPPLILIAGGKDKGGSYLPLKEPIRKKVKALVLLGEARERMHKNLGGATATFLTDSLQDAVIVAFSKSTKGDTILFSPGCSSFDMFQNYEHRGQCFKKLVCDLQNNR